MDIKYQVPDREWCEEMNKHQIYFPDSLYVWMYVTRRSILQKGGGYKTRHAYWKLTPRKITKNCPNQKFDAPMVGELSEALPNKTTIIKDFSLLRSPAEHWRCDVDNLIPYCTDYFLSNAMAKMLIVLKEYNLL